MRTYYEFFPALSILLLIGFLIVVQAFLIGRRRYKAGMVLPTIYFLSTLCIFFFFAPILCEASFKEENNQKVVFPVRGGEETMQEAVGKLMKNNIVTVFLLIPYLGFFRTRQDDLRRKKI